MDTHYTCNKCKVAGVEVERVPVFQEGTVIRIGHEFEAYCPCCQSMGYGETEEGALSSMR